MHRRVPDGRVRVLGMGRGQRGKLSMMTWLRRANTRTPRKDVRRRRARDRVPRRQTPVRSRSRGRRVRIGRVPLNARCLRAHMVIGAQAGAGVGVWSVGGGLMRPVLWIWDEL